MEFLLPFINPMLSFIHILSYRPAPGSDSSRRLAVHFRVKKTKQAVLHKHSLPSMAILHISLDRYQLTASAAGSVAVGSVAAGAVAAGAVAAGAATVTALSSVVASVVTEYTPAAFFTLIWKFIAPTGSES